MSLMDTPWTEVLVSLLLLLSGGVVLIAASGLWRLADFFSRMHAPALASTLGAWIVTFASIVHFTAHATEGALALHVWLIIIVLSITAPVTTIVLARAALFRRRQSGDPLPPPLAGRR